MKFHGLHPQLVKQAAARDGVGKLQGLAHQSQKSGGRDGCWACNAPVWFVFSEGLPKLCIRQPPDDFACSLSATGQLGTINSGCGILKALAGAIGVAGKELEKGKESFHC